MSRVFDIGLNLSSSRFAQDHGAVVSSARDQNVAMMALTGVDADGSVLSAQLAQHYGLVATAGVHPHHASGWANAAPIIQELLAQDVVRAVGECGLDFDRNFSTPAEQRIAFEAQIALAIETGMPLFLHEREASDEMIAMLKAAGKDLPPAVLHCFTGGPALAERYLALGLSLGITGWLADERRGGALREAAAMIPDAQLMIETDAPYLYPHNRPVDLPADTPSKKRKPSRQRNEPAYLPFIAQKLAQIRKTDTDYVAKITWRNACEFFDVTEL